MFFLDPSKAFRVVTWTGTAVSRGEESKTAKIINESIAPVLDAPVGSCESEKLMEGERAR